jgi:NADPH:quinone reductase-like Zn-dependent oxidoreductase
VKAAFFERHGGLDVLQVGQLPSPTLGPGDVRIRVKAAALNHLDLFVREGWPGLKLTLPHIGGTDVAGVVTEVAPNVKNVQVGAEVLVNPGPDGHQVIPPDVSIVGETRWGGLAEECVLPATHVIPKPDTMGWEKAAALPLCSITAMQMVKRKGRVRTGDRVLVVGAGGGVAMMAIQIAKALGAWVCATTGGPEKVAKVKRLSVDHVIDYKADPNWSKAAFLATGKKGFDVIIDSVGQATFKDSVRLLGLGGRLVTCGATTGPAGEMDLRYVFWKQLSILGSTMGIPADLTDALKMWQQGKLDPIIDSVYPLEQVREAQEKLEKAGQFGKIVLTP